MALNLGAIVNEEGLLTPWGQGQMDALAARTGWFGFPGALKFANDDEELTDTAFVWLNQLTTQGSLPLPPPVANSGGLAALLARYGVTV